MNRTFNQRVLWFAFFFYVFVLVIDAAIFLISHVPPRAVNMDRILFSLGEVAAFLKWPRAFLRHLWRSETTPRFFNYLLSLLNCLIWGAMLAGLKALWSKLRG